MQTPVQIQPVSAQMDALITKLKTFGEGPLLIEHLQTAHAYLHGAMPEECAHNLELAQEAADTLSNSSLEHEVKAAITGILHQLRDTAPAHWRHHPTIDQPVKTQPPSATARGLREFFQGEDKSLGIFYPKKHVVAVFPSFDGARIGRDTLSNAGFQMWEVIAVPGEEVACFLEELRNHHSLWTGMMMEFSRLLDTEASLVDCYRQWGREGAGFLMAHSATQSDAEGIFELLKPLHPTAVHWFMAGYIRHLL